MSMQTLLSASLSLTRLQTMQSVQTRTQGRINVLNAEIRQDGGNKNKEEQVKDLEERSQSILGGMMEELGTVTETLKPEDEKEAGAGHEPNTDRVVLSGQPAEGAADQARGGAAVRGDEPLVYGADGKPAQAAAAPAGRRVDATA